MIDKLFGALLGACVAAGMAHAQPGPMSLEKVDIHYHRGPGAPMSIGGFEHHHAYRMDAVSVKGKRWTGLITVSSPKNGTIHFPPLRNAEIVPMFGRLYRMQGSAAVRLKPDQIPKGIAIQSDSFVIPLMRDETGSANIMYRAKKNQYHQKTVFVASIVAGDKKKEAVAQVKFDDSRKEAVTIRRGDALQFGEDAWVVRSIIPASPGRHILGWVELSRK
jgi:hypothetical protein